MPRDVMQTIMDTINVINTKLSSGVTVVGFDLGGLTLRKARAKKGLYHGGIFTKSLIPDS